MRAILLNGPPYCGKDTIGGYLERHLERSSTVKFAKPINDYMQETFGVSCADGGDKGAPCDALNGASRRQIAIAYSEEWIKPKFGIGWFGKQAIKEMRRLESHCGLDTFVFTDSGFSCEALEVVQAIGIENVLQIRIRRPGYDFSSDSRSYWDIHGLRVMEFDNDGTLGELYPATIQNLLPAIKRWARE